MEEKIFWHAFAMLRLSLGMQRAALAYFGCVREAMLAGTAGWHDFFQMYKEISRDDKEGISTELEDRVFERLQRDHDREYESLARKGISFVTEQEENFPEALLRLFDRPHWMYFIGSLPHKEETLISVVGARKCTSYGSSVAKHFASALADASVGIVSGMAYGVDRAAHEGALARGGKTYAILGCGVDICYPKSNNDIYERIRNGNGAVISEYPPGTEPLPCFFPQRNRIIAGIADGILVTEARKKSGSLITVSLGLEFGKNIYAVPGRITDSLSEGCNLLLAEGAKPVMKPSDILADFEWKLPSVREGGGQLELALCEKNENTLATNEKIVYASLRSKQKHMEELLSETKLSMEELSTALHSLFTRGYIKRYGQAVYAVSGEEKFFLPER